MAQNLWAQDRWGSEVPSDSSHSLVQSTQSEGLENAEGFEVQWRRCRAIAKAAEEVQAAVQVVVATSYLLPNANGAEPAVGHASTPTAPSAD